MDRVLVMPLCGSEPQLLVQDQPVQAAAIDLDKDVPSSLFRREWHPWRSMEPREITSLPVTEQCHVGQGVERRGVSQHLFQRRFGDRPGGGTVVAERQGNRADRLAFVS